MIQNTQTWHAYYIFKRSAGLSFGCWQILADISFAISSDSSGLPAFVTRLQIMVNTHSRSVQQEKNYVSGMDETFSFSSTSSFTKDLFVSMLTSLTFHLKDVCNNNNNNNKRSNLNNLRSVTISTLEDKIQRKRS